jgi:hypothetical protein
MIRSRIVDHARYDRAFNWSLFDHRELDLCFWRHAMHSLNRASLSEALRGCVLLLFSLRNVLKFCFSFCGDEALSFIIRVSISSATLKRVQPGTVAARLTSRHFG